MAYVKLFGSILDSTVWEAPATTRVVWITMLAMADRDGVLEASVPGLARRAGVKRKECEAALALFLAPDSDSRTKEHDGRRVEAIDGGWRLLNYEKYRDKASAEEAKAKAAARQKRYRDRQAARRGVTVGDGRNAPVIANDAGDGLRSISEASASPPSHPKGAGEGFIWQRAAKMWVDAMGVDGVSFDISYHQDAFRSIVKQAGTEENLARLLPAYAGDKWVGQNSPPPSHLAKCFYKLVRNKGGQGKSLADLGIE